MKKIFALCAVVAVLLNVTTASAGGLKSSIDLDYQMYGDKTKGVGATVVMGLLAVGVDYFSYNQEFTNFDKDNDYWTIHAGLNKRIFLMDALFVDLRGGLFYQNLKAGTKLKDLDFDVDLDLDVDVDEGNVDPNISMKSNDFGFYLYPRVGLKLIKNLAVTAGYKMNFLEWTFKKEPVSDAFTIGASLLF